MNTTHIRTKSVTAALGAALAAVAAPALLFLGAGTAHAIQDVNDIIDPGSTVGIEDPGIRPPMIIDPGSKVDIVDPGLRVGLGGPDTRLP
jgi:hypothetical protein